MVYHGVAWFSGRSAHRGRGSELLYRYRSGLCSFTHSGELTLTGARGRLNGRSRGAGNVAASPSYVSPQEPARRDGREARRAGWS